ncbi:unnamed protein product [Brassica oleracea var. botrytis]|uniref:(rape) hypothetical protein n=1 Tax=Brassica napus TaxID=3708 RepID=A0A078G4A9_BRANA|nr:unnamed protein product [Brassica napus]CDY20231.1 BnaC09g30080D [Brassica napus]
MDLDISLREERLSPSKKVDETKKWDRSNRISMMLAAVEKCYEKNVKSEVEILLDEFSSMRKQPDESVREYIMTKMSVAAKMKQLGMHIPDDVVVSMLLASLPSEYDHLKNIYSCGQKKWPAHELIYHCLQDEDSWKLEKKTCDLAVVDCGKKRKKFEE